MGGLVSGVGSLLGFGSNNAGFQAQGANILAPTTASGAATAYNQAQSGISQQDQLAKALAAQNGVANQQGVFSQLQGVANGTGPNPAQAMLNQSTGQNVANQAALMAGQRGANQNVGLLARQIGQQGANIQQNAAGQAATLQANQSLGALNQLGGIAGQQVGEQQTATGNYGQLGQQQEQGQLSSINAQNQAQISNQSNLNNTNAQIAAQNAKNSAGAIGGLVNGLGGYFGLGAITGDSSSGESAPGTGATPPSTNPYFGANATSNFGFAQGGMVNPKVDVVNMKDRFPGQVLEPHLEHLARIYHGDKFSKGGKVPAMVSPGEVYLPPEKANKVIKEGKNPLKEGEKIKGKAQVKGNSPKNDTVPKELDEGGVVIPRSVMESDDPSGNAAKFVEALAKKNAGKPEHGDFKMALKKAISSRKAG